MEKQKQPLRSKPPFLGIAFFFLLGFFIVKREINTEENIYLLVFGWILLLISIVLSISTLYKIFKPHFKKK